MTIKNNLGIVKVSMEIKISKIIVFFNNTTSSISHLEQIDSLISLHQIGTNINIKQITCKEDMNFRKLMSLLIN